MTTAQPLRIAQVSTPHESTPPLAYGSINRIVADLTDELVNRGHDVHLYATGDSRTTATLHSVYEQPSAEFVDVGRDWMHSLRSLRALQGFDVVHNHNLFSGSALSFLVDTPVFLTTAHFYTHRDQDFLGLVGSHEWAVQSRSQQRRMSWLGASHVVAPGIRTEDYGGSFDDEGYLLVLGQVGDHKGVREAIDVARRCGVPVVIAGPVPPAASRYFDDRIRPVLGPGVDYVGEVGGETRLQLLRGARGLLMLSKVPESFGLACIEAMASGTPAIVSSRGALPELVVHGVTGFVADTEDERCAAVERLTSLSAADCRTHVEDRYTVAHMADRYLSLFRVLLTQRSGVMAPVGVS